MEYLEKRKTNRISTFGNVYVNDKVGFMVDLSLGGIKLWVKRNVELNENEKLIIEIEPPQNEFNEEINPVHVQVLRKKDRSSIFTEIGCQFYQLNSHQEEYIQNLKKWFEGHDSNLKKLNGN